jgi:hypothetical protein
VLAGYLLPGLKNFHMYSLYYCCFVVAFIWLSFDFFPVQFFVCCTIEEFYSCSFVHYFIHSICKFVHDCPVGSRWSGGLGLRFNSH